MKQYSSENRVSSMTNKNKPAIFVNAGETICIETLDCFSGEILEETTLLKDLSWDMINPATGPIYVNGANKGDILKVEINNIELDDRVVILKEFEDIRKYNLDAKENSIILNCSGEKVYIKNGIDISVSPMIGVIGTAPENEVIPTTLPGVHGGNMDNKHICIGSKVYLPVYHEGALLSLGDLHAAMGDGEATGSGLEIGGKVTITIEVIKNCSMPLPMVETDELIETVYSASSLDEAAEKAVKNMLLYLTKSIGLAPDIAWILLSAKGDVGICQFANALKTARCSIEKCIIKNELNR